MPWPVVRRPSVRPSLAFHFFDISSRTISWIVLKLNGRHCGNMEIQNFRRSITFHLGFIDIYFIFRHNNRPPSVKGGYNLLCVYNWV